jgi:hypothetical protein
VKLLPEDWIKAGPGLLHASPFVSRCLLYRLYDQGCSFLIYHSPNVSSITEVDGETAESISSVVVRQPGDLRVHFSSSSAETSLNGLLELSPSEMKLSNAVGAQKVGDKLALFVEPCKLEMRGLFLLGPERNQRHEYGIENTGYSVSSPAPIKPVGRATITNDLLYECWRVRITSIHGNVVYSIASARSWSLTALGDEEGWRPRLDLRLGEK